MTTRIPATQPPLLAFLTLAGLAGCASDDTETTTGDGKLVVQLEAEDTITDGLEPGSDEENLVDGWTVTYDKYIVALGNVQIGRGSKTRTGDTNVVIDLTQLPTTGFNLASFDDLATGQWDRFEYELLTASDASRDSSVSGTDYARMSDAGLTYLVAGEATKDSVAITFEFAVPAKTHFGPCEAEEGAPGFVVVEGTDTVVAATIHGDHLFFNGFPSGAEITERRADWIRLADEATGGDGHVDTDDLAGIAGTDLEVLFPTGAPANEGDAQYFLAGSPVPVNTALDFVVGQL
ncbi:MAG: hypothetical protein KC417_17735, partial [Myxococcales bacterium]|nr:hypothetical protein [Myxococcales bacterium]